MNPDQIAEYVAFSEEQLLRVIVYLGDRLRGGLTPLAEDAQDCIDWARHYLAEQYDGEEITKVWPHCPKCDGWHQPQNISCDGLRTEHSDG